MTHVHPYLLVQLLHADQIKRLNAEEKREERERKGRREKEGRGEGEKRGEGERTLKEPPDTSSPGHRYLPLGSMEEHHSNTLVKHNGKQ